MEYMKTKDFAKTFNLPARYVSRRCHQGTLPHLKNGKTYIIDVVAAKEKLDQEALSNGNKMKTIPVNNISFKDSLTLLKKNV